ncbi:MAG TPA: hypothetical protein VFH08_01620 [Chitinophagaceae bacterium]|nr:hypothetical protein [Chitinophagaceae bacterium]
MKMIKAVGAVLALAIMPGCVTVFSNGNNDVNHALSPTGTGQTIISSWFSMPLFPISDRTEFYLEGTKYFNKPVVYDKDYHVELAYAMIGGEGLPVYKFLPMNLDFVTDKKTEEFSFRFAIDHLGFSLSVRSLDPAVITIDPRIYQDFFYRYIVIPRSLFNSLSIDWDNYDEVAAAFNL